jgi:hypothetical protein
LRKGPCSWVCTSIWLISRTRPYKRHSYDNFMLCETRSSIDHTSQFILFSMLQCYLLMQPNIWLPSQYLLGKVYKKDIYYVSHNNRTSIIMCLLNITTPTSKVLVIHERVCWWNEYQTHLKTHQWFMCYRPSICTFPYKLHAIVHWVDVSLAVVTCFFDVYLIVRYNGTNKALICTNITTLCVCVHKSIFLPLPKTSIFSFCNIDTKRS